MTTRAPREGFIAPRDARSDRPSSDAGFRNGPTEALGTTDFRGRRTVLGSLTNGVARMKVPSLLLLAGLVLAGCGREAESADPEGETRVELPAVQVGAPVAPPGQATPEGAPHGGGVPAPGADLPNLHPRGGGPAPEASEPVRPAAGTPAPSPMAAPVPVVRSDPTPAPAEVVRDAVRGEGAATEDPDAYARDAGPDRAPEQEEPGVRLARGTVLRLGFEDELSTGVSAVGDTFWAVVEEDVLAADGMVLVPIGTMARGHVRSIREERSEERARIDVVLDALVLEGAEYPITSIVTRTEPIVVASQSGKEVAGKVAAGAAAGAILGRILGKDKESTIHGAVAGAVAGTAVAMATQGERVVLEKGSPLVVRLERELVLPVR